MHIGFIHCSKSKPEERNVTFRPGLNVAVRPGLNVMVRDVLKVI